MPSVGENDLSGSSTNHSQSSTDDKQNQQEYPGTYPANQYSMSISIARQNSHPALYDHQQTTTSTVDLQIDSKAAFLVDEGLSAQQYDDKLRQSSGGKEDLG